MKARPELGSAEQASGCGCCSWDCCSGIVPGQPGSSR